MILEDLPGTTITREEWETRRLSYISKGKTPEQAADRIEAERFREISRVIFDPIVDRYLRMSKRGPLDGMFRRRTTIVRRENVVA